MDADTEGSEEDDDDTDEEADASTWHRKFKGKDKVKMSKPKPKMAEHTIAELEAMLPQFSGEAYGIMDEMNPEADREIESLKLSDRPDMARYIELVLDRASRQADVLQEMDPVPSQAISEIDKRGRMLYFLFRQTEHQMEAAEDVEQETPSLAGSENIGDDGDVNMCERDETGE